jgi:hypothetical protein
VESRPSTGSLSQSQYTETEDGQFVHGSPGSGRRGFDLLGLLRSVGSVFTVANAVLKSASHAIPVAGAYAEIKESVEAGIDLVTTGASWVRRLYRRLRPGRG